MLLRRPLQFTTLRYLALAGVCAMALATDVWGQSDTRPPQRPDDEGSSSRVLVQPQGLPANPFQPQRQPPAKIPLALEGFCVVSLRDGQEWVAGETKHQIIFDGQLYWFATTRHRAIFAQAPGRYAPALSGDCIVTFAETGQRIPGNIKHAILHGQRLYFFANESMQSVFQADPQKFQQVDLAQDGNCLVTYTDLHRELPGLPATLVIVDGVRYLFAGVQQKAQFLSNMDHYGVTPPAKYSPSAEQVPEESAAKPLPTQQQVAELSAEALALQGYCAVTIRTRGLWQNGKGAYQEIFDGRKYYFFGEEEKSLFLQTPDNYVPALGGDCPVTKVETGRLAPGSVFHPIIFRDRLYLLADAAEKAKFKAQPKLYADADLGAQGNCLVTAVEEGRSVPGQPEFVAWHQGLRYLFASPAEQVKFRENPDLYLK